MSREDMAVGKDPTIKLFGRTIFAQTSDTESLDTGSTLMQKPETKECKTEHLGTTSKSITHHNEDDSHNNEVEPNPPFKRPDTILPCPRCNSPDTKFCYFNNYNVNQPRHFCKSCQRYWTAGGTVRNVPVGAGRRRNKHLHYRHVIADVGPAEMPGPTVNNRGEEQVLEESSSSCTTTSGMSISLVGQDPSSPNETVLKFGPESPYCDEKAGIPHGGSRLNGTLTVPGCSAIENCLQFVPGSYWNCIPVWVAGPGNISLALANASPPFFSNEKAMRVLGKHSRDTNAVNEEIVEQGFRPPKTLRIHNVDKAA